ncbi:hypothetical protein [Geoglobus acetivorans]|uniref:Galactose-1-phosphate uridylyltransferase n=1 Tax=Geoglobus acetivorans TaxID=565033 RepID=A0ABZ3H2Y9_GEOAI|nr:hypothetical protein [Geoglobus acetivorans]
MEFRTVVEKAEFLNPMTNEIETVDVEVRFDLLTGKPSRIITKPLPFSTEPELPDFSNEWCPFCEENIYKVGCRDVKVAKGELMKRGEAILMANISPYARNSLVVRLSKAHYIPIGEFRPELFTDAFLLTQEYMAKLEPDFVSVTMNYMKSAGSSLTHPHIQVLVTEVLMDYQGRVRDCAEKFYSENNANFWKVFWENAENLRIFEGAWKWYAPFSPRGFEHVSAFMTKGFEEIDEEDFSELSEGIVKVLKYYGEKGYNAFNFGLFASFRTEEYLASQFDIVARSVMDKYYWNDIFAITKVYDETYSNRLPEETAEELKKYFS